MYIGLGIVFLVLGFVLAFDVVTLDIPHVDDGALGAILIAAGILAIVLSLVMSDRARRQTIVDERPVVEQRRVQ